VYGAALSLGTSAFTTSGLVNGDAISSVTLTSSGAAASAGVGSYAIVPSAAVFGSGSASNYVITYANGTLTVSARPLSITANDQSKTYGQTFTFAGSEFTVHSGDLVNGDTVTSVTLSSAGAAATAAASGECASIPVSQTSSGRIDEIWRRIRSHATRCESAAASAATRWSCSARSA
jgi:hypothetical protein